LREDAKALRVGVLREYFFDDLDRKLPPQWSTR